MSVLSRPQEKAISRASFRIHRELVLLGVIGVVFVIFARLAPNFLSPLNFQITSRYIVEAGLISIGMTMVIIMKGIDISVGSMLALAAVTMGIIWQTFGVPLPLAAVVAVLVGTLCGLINGLIITRVRVPDLVVTLATFAIYRGIAEGISGGARYYLFKDPFAQVLGQGTIAGVPISIFILIPAVLIGGLVLSKTAFGRYVYAIGINETAARFAGVKADRVRLIAYTLCGLFSGMGAVLSTTRLGTARSTAGLGLEFEVITAVVVGGTSIAGGEGSVWGSILGLIFVTMLRNGLNLIGVPTPTQAVVIGIILIVTVLINENIRRR